MCVCLKREKRENEEKGLEWEREVGLEGEAGRERERSISVKWFSGSISKETHACRNHVLVMGTFMV